MMKRFRVGVQILYLEIGVGSCVTFTRGYLYEAFLTRLYTLPLVILTPECSEPASLDFLFCFSSKLTL